nr:hypothetical protein [Pseudomonadota bacterium]
MIDLRTDELRSDRTVMQLFLADIDAHHNDIDALALTQIEFDALRRPSVTGWRHFLRLQGLEFKKAGFDLKIAAQTLATLAWTPSDFLELLAGVHADVGEAPALALPVLHRRLLGHLSQ